MTQRGQNPVPSLEDPVEFNVMETGRFRFLNKLVIKLFNKCQCVIDTAHISFVPVPHGEEFPKRLRTLFPGREGDNFGDGFQWRSEAV